MTPKVALPIGVLALAAIIAGVVVLWGAGWGLLVGGVLVLIAVVLLVELDGSSHPDGITPRQLSWAMRSRARQAGKPL